MSLLFQRWLNYFNSSATFQIGSRKQFFTVLKSVFYGEPSGVVIVFGGTNETLTNNLK